MSYSILLVNDGSPDDVSLTSMTTTPSPNDGDFLVKQADESWAAEALGAASLQPLGSMVHSPSSYSGGGTVGTYQLFRSGLTSTPSVLILPGTTWFDNFKVNLSGTYLIEIQTVNYVSSGYDAEMQLEINGALVGNRARIAPSTGRFGSICRAIATISNTSVFKIKAVAGQYGTQAYQSFQTFHMTLTEV